MKNRSSKDRSLWSRLSGKKPRKAESPDPVRPAPPISGKVASPEARRRQMHAVSEGSDLPEEVQNYQIGKSPVPFRPAERSLAVASAGSTSAARAPSPDPRDLDDALAQDIGALRTDLAALARSANSRDVQNDIRQLRTDLQNLKEQIALVAGDLTPIAASGRHTETDMRTVIETAQRSESDMRQVMETAQRSESDMRLLKEAIGAISKDVALLKTAVADAQAGIRAQAEMLARLEARPVPAEPAPRHEPEDEALPVGGEGLFGKRRDSILDDTDPPAVLGAGRPADREAAASQLTSQEPARLVTEALRLFETGSHYDDYVMLVKAFRRQTEGPLRTFLRQGSVFWIDVDPASRSIQKLENAVPDPHTERFGLHICIRLLHEERGGVANIAFAFPGPFWFSGGWWTDTVSRIGGMPELLWDDIDSRSTPQGRYPFSLKRPPILQVEPLTVLARGQIVIPEFSDFDRF